MESCLCGKAFRVHRLTPLPVLILLPVGGGGNMINPFPAPESYYAFPVVMDPTIHQLYSLHCFAHGVFYHSNTKVTDTAFLDSFILPWLLLNVIHNSPMQYFKSLILLILQILALINCFRLLL